MDLTHTAVFRDNNVFQQIQLLDNFYDQVDLTAQPEATLYQFLSAAIGQSPNSYVRRTAFKIMAELTLAGNLSNTFATLGSLQQLLTDSDESLKTIALKYLHFFPEQVQGTLLETVKDLSDSPDGEVASQACLCLGITHLAGGLRLQEVPQLIIRLQECQAYFRAAAGSAENRIDADFFSELTGFILSVLSGDTGSAGRILGTLEKNLQVRQLYAYEDESLALDYLIYRNMQLLKETLATAAASGSWLEIRPNVQTLFDLKSEREKTGLADPRNLGLIKKLNQNALDRVEENIFSAHLSGEKQRMVALKVQTKDDGLADFIAYLLTLFPDGDQARPDNHQLLAMLSEHLGSDVALDLYAKIQSKELSLEKVVNELLKKESENQLPFKTGSIQGQEILLSLMAQLDQYLPAYPRDKRQIFMNILEEVIRYARRSFVNNDKSRFRFLFSKAGGGKGQEAIEQDLQDNMLLFFEHSRIADGLEHEKAKFVDGGRVDIVYKKNQITIPVELKKSLLRPDQAALEENYIAQAQTYTAGYDQIGLFVLMELSDKSKEPPPNFKDWFKIHHLPPATNQQIDYPDYVVSVIIPGNRTSPSAKSTYK